MAHEFKLSEIGLKLIKAYEGFRPVETSLVSGQRVIGYGHKYMPDEEPVISRQKAEDLLLEDLEPYEAMVNDSIFAPLNQSQFDALVSLSYNIGPRAFLSSTVLHALNNGRPLEAAAAFDEWRKSNIDGKIYVVDALVRRRTAEKALFLRPMEGVVAAPRHEVPAQSDAAYPKNETDMPVYGRYDLSGIVARAPYDKPGEAEPDPDNYRRREDGPAGALMLSEVADGDTDVQSALDTPPEMPADTSVMLENEEGLSPIAVAAAEVSERLEALIGDRPDNASETVLEPETVLETQVSEPLILEDLPLDDIDDLAREPVEYQPEADMPAPANDGTHEEYRRPGRNKPAQLSTPDIYISSPEVPEPVEETKSSGAYWTALIFGATLLGGGAAKWFLTPKGALDEISAFLAPVATIVGAMVVLGALYYLVKALMRPE